MKLLISTVDRDSSAPQDVVLGASGATTVRELVEHLAGTGGSVPDCYLGQELLDPETPLSDSGIRNGSVLGLGRPVPRGTGAYGPERDEMPLPVEPPDDVGTGPTVELKVVGGPDAGRVHLLGLGTHDIGPAPGSAVPLPGRDVPAAGIRLTVRPDGTAIAAVPPQGEVRLSLPEPPPERRRVDEPDLPPEPADDPAAGTSDDVPSDIPAGWVEWPLGGEMVIGEYLLRLAAPTEADAAVAPSEEGTGLDYNRPPRLIPPLAPEQFRLPGPPKAPGRRPIPMLIMIAPLFMGAGMVFVLHSYYFLLFTLMSPIMIIGNHISGRRQGRREYHENVRNYRARRANLEADVREKVEDERRLRVLSAPDPAAVGLMAVGPGARLWERRRSDPDHLMLRIGTSRQPSLLLVDDGAREDNHRSVRWQIPDVPVAVDLAGSGVVGLAGEGPQARALARWAVAQAAVLHSPRDLRITVLTDAESADSWSWIRWLPHARTGSGSGQEDGGKPVTLLGNDPETVANRVAELVSAIRTRSQADRATMSRALLSEPDIMVVLDGARRLRDIPGVVQVLKEGPAFRIFLLCVDQEERLLPEECVTVVSVGRHELTARRTGQPDQTGIRPDFVEPAWCERLARGIAPVRDVTPDADGGLPDKVNLLDVLELEPPQSEQIAERWRKRPANTSAVLGSGYDGPVAFDLVRDGPHALIAGTTGSGKSELLQTFVASLAVANHPEELSFVLVDYKGGSAFKECVRLPHTLGMVTDLDSHLVQRALESLTAELVRREHILAKTGAKDHPEYRAMRRRDPSLPPLPRLLLIIDEFATLARDVEDFIPGLVGIAQRGRSLGIHLVLATQRPAGVVTNDIRANTNLRIALRVTDAGESQDVLDTSDAVTISSATPGRALARTGHRSVQAFQTAFVGAPRLPDESADEQPRSRLWSAELPWQRLGRAAEAPSPGEETAEIELPDVPTDLTALVEAVSDAAASLDHTPLPSPWLPALGTEVRLGDLPEPPPPGRGQLAPVVWAMEDLPALQLQVPVTLDLAHFGHLYVLGMPRSGRTQVLRTLAGSVASTLSCEDVHLYGIDAGGGALTAMTVLPHCGAVVSRADLERLDRLISRLVAELARRQELLTAHSAGNLTELRATLPAGLRPPHIILMIDGYDALNGIISEHDNGRLLNDLLALLREGTAAGMHVIATSERALASGRLSVLNDDHLLLRLNDRTEYSVAGIDARRVPAAVPPGRGWRTTNGAELQVALLGPGSTGQEQAEALRAIGKTATTRHAKVPTGRRPFRVGVLPARVDFKEAYDKVPAERRRPLWALLGLGGDDVAPVGVDFADKAPTFVVAGPPGTGRSTTLASLGVSLLAGGTKIVAVTPRESPLRALDQHPQARVLARTNPSAEELRGAIEELGGPAVVLVDDADLIENFPAAEPVLKDLIASGRDRGLGLACAATAETLTNCLSGWLSEAKRGRKGILLSPQSMMEGDLIGARLAHNLLRVNRPAGRGLTTDPQTGALITVLVPETVLRG
ncbi:FtsK/SpoIIIE domain-containing protein [Streptomyces lunalinharesii]|uniref:FtsK/SpoIIIE domain-containing protein n=1 Tax=Streptomyces lunalinharesii TaxID=333384 RepID=A0ABN3SL48_9ACTN